VPGAREEGWHREAALYASVSPDLRFYDHLGGDPPFLKPPAYGASKAALINLAETLRNQLIERGIRISVINPGYVATPMTSVNKFPMPFLISAEDAARRIVRGLQKGRFEIAFPWQLIAMAKLGRVLPYPLYFWYARTFLSPPRKK
jgi:short-subunit dehydrogenase